MSNTRKFPTYGWVGLGIIVLGEILCWAKVFPFHIFITPIAWTGYIMLVDALIFQRKKESLILTRTGEFVVMVALSVMLWLVFELYNVLLQNWHYVGLPENLLGRYFGYTWSFA